MTPLQQRVARVRLAARFPLRVGRLVLEELRYPALVKRWREATDGRVRAALNDLAQQGYHRVEGFWDEERIRRWQERLDAYCARTDLPEKHVKRRIGGTRWSRVERGLPELADAYLQDPFVWGVATAYHGRPDLFRNLGYQHSLFDPSLSEVKARNQRIGRGRESYVIGLGRDGFHIDDADYGLKAMLLLTDVAVEHGPLTYCPGTHRVAFDRFTFVKEAKLLRYLFQLDTLALYFQEDDAKRLGLDERAIRFTGARGTLIFFETRGFHKAGPLLRGERKVLWGSFGVREKGY